VDRGQCIDGTLTLAHLVWHNFVMTKSANDAVVRGADDRRCRWCRSVLATHSGAGRPRQFCSHKCRQWDWVARQRAHDLALSDGELVIAREQLDRLHDDVYVLACAVADTRRDLASPMNAEETRQTLEWLLAAAEPLAERRLPSASRR
jgi:hypothetical protein